MSIPWFCFHLNDKAPQGVVRWDDAIMRIVRGELKAILAAADVAGDVLVVGS